MKNVYLSVALILTSWWIANTMTTVEPSAMWWAAACLFTGVFGVVAGIATWAEWEGLDGERWYQQIVVDGEVVW